MIHATWLTPRVRVSTYFEVEMRYAFAVHMLDAEKDLFDEVRGLLLGESLLFRDEIE